MAYRSILRMVPVAAFALAALACENPARGKAELSIGEAAKGLDSKPVEGATSYRFDAQTSKVSWTGAKVTGKHDGGFDSFNGSIDLVEGKPEKSRVTVDIDATSLTSDNAKLTKHLKSADFFDVEKYPRIRFTSTKVVPKGEPGKYDVTGNLELHGVTKAVSFPATINKSGDAVQAAAEFSFNRRDFGINYAGMANDLIRDEVVVRLNVHAKAGQS